MPTEKGNTMKLMLRLFMVSAIFYVAGCVGCGTFNIADWTPFARTSISLFWCVISIFLFLCYLEKGEC